MNSFIFLKENDWIMGIGTSELPKNMCTQGTGARAQVQGLDIVLGQRLRAQFVSWALEKKKGVFTLVPSEYLTRTQRII